LQLFVFSLLAAHTAVQSRIDFKRFFRPLYIMGTPSERLNFYQKPFFGELQN
jgi:hypothetical protein